LNEERILASIYGLLIGDALGEPFEGLNRESIVRDRVNLREIKLTDDSILSLIVASSLIEKKRVDRKDIAGSILKNRSFIVRMGPTTSSAISHIEKNIEYISKEGTTNGAAMRAPPIGWIIESDNIKEICESVYLSSSITHGTDVAISGACAVAEAVSTALDGYSRERIIENALNAAEIGERYGVHVRSGYRLRKRLGEVLEDGRNLGEIAKEFCYSIETIDTVPLVMASLKERKNFKETLIDLVSLGGDTDTMAAIAGSILGAEGGLKGIPKEWVDKVEVLNQRFLSNLQFADRLTVRNERGLDLREMAKRLFEIRILNPS
jgi:ADP-ribosylglycohydrolase